MILRVDTGSSVPLHEQLAGQLRAAIAAGDPAPGDRLPSGRELARSLDMNLHTVLRAYQTLQQEGLVEVRRGRGTIVTTTAPRLADLADLAHRLVVEGRRAGVPDQEIIRLVEAQL
ncbi:MAG: GntR family transcriptional regulator [Acidimicrobiales bacterium]